MKRLLLLPAFCVALNISALAADATVGVPPEAPPDLSSFKTADDMWKHLEKLQQPPMEKPATRAEALQQVQTWLNMQKAGSDAFVKAFPEDPRSWKARLTAIRADAQLRRFTGEAGNSEAERQKLDEIINAPAAPEPIKGEAAFMKVLTMAATLDKSKPETYAAFLKGAGEYVEKYPEHPLAAKMKGIEVQLLADDASPQGEAALKKFAASSDKDLAAQAQATLDRREKMAGLKTKPVDLKFTAADGHEIDLAKYRGKVVLVDFWASWCGPCMGEMPNVVSTYDKLHPKGFEIVGISLDQDKAAMEGALKKQNMSWPQYFDGAGWQNKISSSFGIQSIPAAWLLDKKGMLRETDLRGEALGSAVEKLLAE